LFSFTLKLFGHRQMVGEEEAGQRRLGVNISWKSANKRSELESWKR